MSIYCLQDTHLTNSQIRQVRSIWGNDIIMSPGNTNSRGTIILFNDNFEYVILRSKTDKEGNMVATEIKLQNTHTLTLINIYGPNRDSPEFYRILRDVINEFNSNFVIITGDFNLVLDPNRDCDNYKHINNPNARKEVFCLRNDFNLVDVWRTCHSDECVYTWFSSVPGKRARLDFFLASQELLSLVDKADIFPGYRTDYSLITLSLKIDNHKKGKGFWAFNNALLKDNTYVQLVKNEIRKTIIQYALENDNSLVENTNNTDIDFNIDDKLFLDILLTNIRGVTISYASYRKRSRDKKEKEFESEIMRLEQLPQLSTELYERLNIIKDELKEYRKEKVKGIMIRTKARWIEDGEKPSKYFF